MPAPGVHYHLETHFGIVRQNEFGVVHWLYESVRSTSVDMSYGQSDSLETSRGTEKGQKMCSRLILVALPFCYIMKDITRILVGTGIYGGMKSEFQFYLVNGSVGEPWLKAHTWQGIASLDIAVKLIVLEESQCLQFYAQGLCPGRIHTIWLVSHTACHIGIILQCRPYTAIVLCIGKHGTLYD